MYMVSLFLCFKAINYRAFLVRKLLGDFKVNEIKLDNSSIFLRNIAVFIINDLSVHMIIIF